MVPALLSVDWEAMTTPDDLFAAIDAGDLERVRELVAAHATLAGARDVGDVSAVMHALYHGQRPIAEARGAGHDQLAQRLERAAGVAPRA
jgi:hypothetical protein